jgi:hypothetical protein
MNLRLVFIVFILVSFSHTLSLQRANAQYSRAKTYKLTGSECAEEISFSQLGIERLIQQARRKGGHGPPYFEEAAILDLNGDEKKEYLVRVSCGGTGNCDWAVITRSPIRFLGIIAGQYLYVEKTKGRWPEIKTYTHTSASEGVIATYKYNGKRYRWSGDEKDVNTHLQNVPKPLVRAEALCELHSNPKHLNEVLKK